MNQEGEKDPHPKLVQAYLAKRENLIRFLAARLGSRVLAEDAAQDLFLKLAAVDRDLVVENPTAMLFRMAANLAVDHIRHRRRSLAREQAWGDAAVTMLGEPVADQPSPEQSMAARQSLEALIAAVDELPPRMQKVFQLYKIEGRTRAETAQLMGISVKAVEKQVTAALKALTWRLK